MLDRRQSGIKLSFETWKRKKTIAYRQIFNKIETEQQQKLLENLTNTKWKRITQQVRYNRFKKFTFKISYNFLTI